MPADDIDGPGPTEEILRYLRGRGPRPAAPGADDLFALLDAIADTAGTPDPPLDQDPAAVRLGLVPGGPDPVTLSLHELAHRLGGQVVVEPADDGLDGLGRLRAWCRTLGDTVAVVTTGAGGGDLVDLLDAVAGVFARRPLASAVALVSEPTLLAVVLTEADCVAAAEPATGRAGPALPRPPEPFPLALGRHLERSLPRWDEIARLDEMLVLGGGADIGAVAAEAVERHRSRPARIPAKRAALAALADLDPGEVAAAVAEVRAGALHGDDLLARVRRLAGVGP